MVGYSIQKCSKEKYLQRRINKDYPILFNRVNWQILEENMENLVEFQKQHERILPITFRPYNVENDPEGIYESFKNEIIEAIFSRRPNNWRTYRRDPKQDSYDDVYEFIQQYPEWGKLVYYTKNPDNIYDDILTVQCKDYPIIFNRFDWNIIDQKMNELYQLVLKEKKPILPSILFMYTPSNMSENYRNISNKIYEFYKSEEEKGNKNFENWTYTKRYDYDSVYEFIMAYPEFSDIVFFDLDR